MTDKQRIKMLEEKLAVYEKSPYYGGYMSTLHQLTKWNNELFTNPISLQAVEDGDMRAFDKAMKFLERKKELYEQLEYLRTKLSPEEKADSEKKEVEEHSVEKFILNDGISD